MPSIHNVMDAKQVGELMGLVGERAEMPAMAWALIQEEAAGTSRKEIAQGLGVGESELDGLRDLVTGKEGEESEAIWQQGIIALRVSRMMSDGTLNGGWDAIEAMAVEKLGRALKDMRGNGSPADMLAIATQANKAIRRRRGEGAGRGMGTGVQIGIGGLNQGQGVDMTLKSGELGVLKLSLSPALQQQLANRTIDVTPTKPAGGALNLEMLKLSETRELVEAPKAATRSALDKRFDFSAMMNQGMDDEPGL